MTAAPSQPTHCRLQEAGHTEYQEIRKAQPLALECPTSGSASLTLCGLGDAVLTLHS